MSENARRLLSITFDDGLRHAAEVACELLEPHRMPATFYVVTGWVEPMRAAVREPCNVGRSHGDWRLWRQVHGSGHEVGSHTFSHVNAGGKKAMLMPWSIGSEIEQSFADLQREVPQSSYTISMPWNAATARSERHVRRRFSGCRLGARLAYNDLDNMNRFRLESWAPSPTTSDADLERAVTAIPENGWLILQFHSFDDEGWEPVTRARFSRLCEIATQIEGLAVRTVADVLGRT